MRPIARFLAVVSLAAALPPGARADDDDQRPPPPPRIEQAPARTPEARPAAPAPEVRRDEPGPYPRTVPAPYGRRYQPRPYYYRPHAWWGWGWGWYPLYACPEPPTPPPGQGYAPPPHDEADRITTRFSVYGAGRSNGYVGGLDFSLDGRYAGFDLDVNALASEPVTGPLHESGRDPATWGSAHFTWSLLAERSFRLRILTGGSMLSLPDSPAVADREWRGKTVYGPDVGVSGQIGLLGPLGIEGHARVTPFPVRVADTLIAATLHAGPLGLSGGWRWIDVAGDEKDAPKMSFRGPQVGLSLAF